MTTWLIPANTKFYDVFAALDQPETFWPMNAKISGGDLVYIYLAAPHKQIGFVCEVLATGFDLAMIFDEVSPFIKGESGKGPGAKPFMRLRLCRVFAIREDSALSLARLREHGLNGMLMGARKLENNPALLAYIQENAT